MARQQGTIHIHIGSSNLWTRAKDLRRAKKAEDDVGPDPCFDIGRLKRILMEKSGLDPNQKNFDVKANLYGSTLPPMDTVWKTIEAQKGRVATFARGSWTGREKMVDEQVIADLVEQACASFHQGPQAVFTISSGDRDMKSAVGEITKRQFSAHVWSWKNALSNV